ncbi:MAG: nucleotidyl transferase AbiEii/AbiGii toxin family protein [Phycisphaerae bacterium]|nr:nucleotidyl transferase AbiEii/AbiGii toxin family protein [Phycisphaerae bacterium]
MITSLIKRIARQLDVGRIPYMIIGGQAVLLYGRPRLTRDIDITLGVDTNQYVRIEQLCRDLNLRPLLEDSRDFTIRTKVLPAEDPESRIRVDFIFSFTPYETQAMERTNKVFLDDCVVRFASCEDVIIHKMVAARPIDVEDVRHMIARNKEELDLSYLRHWLAEFGSLPEHTTVLADFEKLLEQ